MKIIKILFINSLHFATENLNINETLLETNETSLNNPLISISKIDHLLFFEEFMKTNKISEINKQEFMDQVVNLQEENKKKTKYKFYIWGKEDYSFYLKLSTIASLIIFTIWNITNIILIESGDFINIIINLLLDLFSVLVVNYINFNFQKVPIKKNIILFIACLIPYIYILITNLLNLTEKKSNIVLLSIIILDLVAVYLMGIIISTIGVFYEIYNYEKNNL